MPIIINKDTSLCKYSFYLQSTEEAVKVNVQDVDFGCFTKKCISTINKNTKKCKNTVKYKKIYGP